MCDLYFYFTQSMVALVTRPFFYSFIRLVSDRCDVVLIDLAFYSVCYFTIQEGEQAATAMTKI